MSHVNISPSVPTELGKHVASVALAAIEKHGSFTVALSGGSLASILEKSLRLDFVQEKLRGHLDKFHIFFVDERYVAYDDADSNYRVIKLGFLDPFRDQLAMNQVYPVPYDVSVTIQDAARQYEQTIRDVFSKLGRKNNSDDEVPVFDLVLLGMGPDGHTASLFPGHPLLQQNNNNNNNIIGWIVDSPKPPPQRITFLFPLIAKATHITFVAEGDAKKEMLARVVEGDRSDPPLPSWLVNQLGEKVTWLVDHSAAALLKKRPLTEEGSS